MSSIFEKLKDETPRPVGEEIGGAVSDALVQVAKSNGALATMLAMSISEAISRVDTRNTVAEAPNPVREWRFRVVRDSNGRMTDVIATAE